MTHMRSGMAQVWRTAATSMVCTSPKLESRARTRTRDKHTLGLNAIKYFIIFSA